MRTTQGETSRLPRAGGTGLSCRVVGWGWEHGTTRLLLRKWGFPLDYFYIWHPWRSFRQRSEEMVGQSDCTAVNELRCNQRSVCQAGGGGRGANNAANWDKGETCFKSIGCLYMLYLSESLVHATYWARGGGHTVDRSQVRHMGRDNYQLTITHTACWRSVGGNQSSERKPTPARRERVNSTQKGATSHELNMSLTRFDQCGHNSLNMYFYQAVMM